MHRDAHNEIRLSPFGVIFKEIEAGLQEEGMADRIHNALLQYMKEYNYGSMHILDDSIQFKEPVKEWDK